MQRAFKDSLYQPYKQKDDFMGLEIEMEVWHSYGRTSSLSQEGMPQFQASQVNLQCLNGLSSLRLESEHNEHNDRSFAPFSESDTGRNKQAPLHLLWKGRAWAVQGPRCEPACEQQESTQRVKDGKEVNLDGLEVEEDVEAQAAAQDDGSPHQKRRRPSKTVRTDTSRSHIWPMGGLCSNDSKSSSRPEILQPLQWGVLSLKPDAGCRGYLGNARHAV